MDRHASPEFAHNWFYPGDKRKDEFVPFQADVFCKAAVIVMMDSASPMAGKAKVYVDGKEALTLDPRVVGWTHNSPLICLNEEESRWHKIEVMMEDGDYDKWFSISGFGIVV